jgi:hypothetical protein
MFGSLNCIHNGWKNGHKAWQASYKVGKRKWWSNCGAQSSSRLLFVVLPALFGYAGSLNYLSILNLSPLLESLLDRTFVDAKKSANVVPFSVAGNLYQLLFVLVDGIYPRYSRFVKGINLPVTESEKSFTAWQEAARKDIEQAFEVLHITLADGTLP